MWDQLSRGSRIFPQIDHGRPFHSPVGAGSCALPTSAGVSHPRARGDIAAGAGWNSPTIYMTNPYAKLEGEGGTQRRWPFWDEVRPPMPPLNLRWFELGWFSDARGPCR